MAWELSYVTPAELAAHLTVDEADEMGLAIAAASRAIDKACGRQFGKSDTAEAQPFKAEYWRGATYVDIDDTFDADLTVTGVDSFTLYPLRARGKPYDQIRIPRHVGDLVEVTAVWGWPEIPDAIKQATLIQAARFYERRYSPGGRLINEQVDDVQRGWATATASDLDPDVLASIAPYHRLWVAV